MRLKIDHLSPLPLHRQIEELLRNLIQTEEYQKGALLPKEVELANRLGVSRNTIRQATNKLEHEGLITRKKGVGTFVTAHGLSTKLSNWHSFTMEMIQKGISFKNREITVQNVEVDKKLIHFFRIKKSAKVLRLQRLRVIDEVPVVFFESYFHPRIALTEDDDFSIPLYQLLEDKFGVVAARSDEHIRAQLAGSLSRKLELSAGDPILVRERFVYDPGDRPIEYNIGYYRGDKFTYSIDIRG